MRLWISIAVFMPLETPELSRIFAFMTKGTTLIFFLIQYLSSSYNFLPMGQNQANCYTYVILGKPQHNFVM